jgi:hypothetical protein
MPKNKTCVVCGRYYVFVGYDSDGDAEYRDCTSFTTPGSWPLYQADPLRPEMDHRPVHSCVEFKTI